MCLIMLATLTIVLTAGGGSGQMLDCPQITKETMESVIMANIPARGHLAVPTIYVLRFHPVCLAYSEERDRYRFVSVVVEYICKGNAQCPSGLAVEQFHSECFSGTWTGRVAGIGRNGRTINPTATISTPTREDCAFCFSPAAAISLGLTADLVTHCVACDSACSDGLMRCYGEDDTDCCQYYNANMCVDACPSPDIPDDEYNCVCPSGHNCFQKCTVNNCSRCDVDPNICEECTGGYTLSSNTCNELYRECTVNNCSKCDVDPDVCEECADGYTLSTNTCWKLRETNNDSADASTLTSGAIVLLTLPGLVVFFALITSILWCTKSCLSGNKCGENKNGTTTGNENGDMVGNENGTIEMQREETF